jgi:predicted PhzF superfamily epimerase YddE/YHI9
VLYNILACKTPGIVFHSKSGPLLISRDKDNILMDFPSWKPERFDDHPAGLEQALGVKEIVGVYKHRDLLVELNQEEDVKNAEPDFTLIKKLGYKIIITAPGREVDFVSRFFAPTVGVDEDPVTGSAHSQLIPFWSEKLGKSRLVAAQLSQRGGRLVVEQKGDRVLMGGKCVFYMKGEISNQVR